MDNHHKLVESISLVQFVDRVGIDIGLSRPRFHLDIKIQHPIFCQHHLPIIGSHLLRVFYTAKCPFCRIILMVYEWILVGSYRCIQMCLFKDACQPLYGYLLMGKSSFKYDVHKAQYLMSMLIFICFSPSLSNGRFVFKADVVPKLKL